MKLPSFPYRQAYETYLNTLDEVVELFCNYTFKESLYFRGMSKYEYICISTFYRYYLSTKLKLKWGLVKGGFQKPLDLPRIDLGDYRKLSFKIIDEFERNLSLCGLKDLSFSSILYLAQHYGLPTNLIDFTKDPKVALYFACEKEFDHDCSVYMYDIFSHIKGLAQHSAKVAKQSHSDATYESILEKYTSINRETTSISTPKINIEDISCNQRIQNQDGVFVYHCDDLPFDNLIYMSSNRTAFDRRRVFKIKASLKQDILKILDKKYGININYLFPNEEKDQFRCSVEKAVKVTKDNLNIPEKY